MAGTDKHIVYTAADIEKYWKGLLSAADQHAMEKAALDDPFLADAIEGYERTHGHMQADNETLQQRLQQRVNDRQKARVIPFGWKAAAAVILLVGAGWLYYANTEKQKASDLVVSTDKKTLPVPAPVAPADSTAIAKTTTTADSGNIIALLEASKKKAYYYNNEKAAAAEEQAKTDTIAAAEVIASNSDDKAREAPVASAPASAKVTVIDNNRGYANTQNEVRSQGFNVNAKRSNNFTIRVTDPQLRPIANAAIQIPELKLATQTDQRGYLSLWGKDSLSGIAIVSPRFETKYIQLEDSASLQQVVLQRRLTKEQLDEVVTKTDGAPRKKAKVQPASLDAEPLIGWEAYMDYLEKNKKVPADLADIHGTVVISFTVREKNIGGFLVEDSLDDQLDQEAIRLVKNGPAWKLLKGKKTRVTLTVVF
ncbi:MAG: hypothetical protein KGO82_01420 [Bacteroidota bacterium]|nr:hypothetical protein [Bacteroidota bacterium]